MSSMLKLIECIPNFSEGKRHEVIQAIADAIASAESVRILDIHSDIDHNRSVITYVVEPQYAVEAGFRAYEKASDFRLCSCYNHFYCKRFCIINFSCSSTTNR